MVNVYIEGSKDGFKSKAAVDKFKTSVKNNVDINISELKERFIEASFNLELLEKTETDIKFKLSKNVDNSQEKQRELLRAKLNIMKKNRTNSDIHKARNNKTVPDDILDEYMKLKKIATMPIPEPSDILSKPEEYKPIIQMVLGNSMMKQYPSNHPYVRYFKLLAEKIGALEPLPVPLTDHSDMTVPDLISPDMIKEIKSNTLNQDASYETDSETDSE